MRAISRRFGIPLRTVRAVALEPVELLRQRYKAAMRVASSGASPWLGDRWPIGTPMIGDYEVPENSYLDFSWRFSPREVMQIRNTEAEQGIKRHPTYERYISWRRMGVKPPPAHVVETAPIARGAGAGRVARGVGEPSQQGDGLASEVRRCHPSARDVLKGLDGCNDRRQTSPLILHEPVGSQRAR